MGGGRARAGGAGGGGGESGAGRAGGGGGRRRGAGRVARGGPRRAADAAQKRRRPGRQEPPGARTRGQRTRSDRGLTGAVQAPGRPPAPAARACAGVRGRRGWRRRRPAGAGHLWRRGPRCAPEKVERAGRRAGRAVQGRQALSPRLPPRLLALARGLAPGPPTGDRWGRGRRRCTAPRVVTPAAHFKPATAGGRGARWKRLPATRGAPLRSSNPRALAGARARRPAAPARDRPRM
jgi:hypothetical protein